MIATSSDAIQLSTNEGSNVWNDVGGNIWLSLRVGTDKGQDGIDNFFNTHTCSPMCAHLGLKPFKGRGRTR